MITGLLAEFADGGLFGGLPFVDESGGEFEQQRIGRRPVLPDQQQAMGGEKFRDQENRSGTAFPGDCFPEAGPVPVAIFQLLQGEPFSASDFFASDNFHESSSYSEKRT